MTTIKVYTHSEDGNRFATEVGTNCLTKIITNMKRFTLYMGLNDKDTKTQQISIVEAYKIVSNILASDFGGGTIYEAKGVYKHDDGTIVFENTLRIEILFAERPQIKSLVELLKKLFNQESIAVQEEEITSDLW